MLEVGPIGLQLLGSLDRYVRKFFDDQKLRQLVQYAAVFLGGNPSSTPRLYSMMSHIDISQGVYYPEGGIDGVIRGIADLARELGVTIETDVEVTEITRWRNRFFVSAENTLWRPDVVVSDIDYAHTELELLPEHERQHNRAYWDKRTYSPSAYILLLGVDQEVDELAHHNVVMPVPWDEHFRDIYDRGRWPHDPVYYVCNASKTDSTVAPKGQSALTLSMAVPAGSEDTPELRQRYQNLLLEDMSTMINADIRDDIVYERVLGVSDFVDQYNVRKGSLGLAQTLRQTGPFRPQHRSTAVDGLYYTGSATNPGVGMPICLISGQHTATAVKADLG